MELSVMFRIEIGTKIVFFFLFFIYFLFFCDGSIKDAHDKRKIKLNLWAGSQQLIKLKIKNSPAQKPIQHPPYITT